MPDATMTELKAVFDTAAKLERFSDGKLFEQTEALRKTEPASTLSAELERFLTPAQIQLAHRRLVRAAFLIELVKDDVTSTKYDVRWTDRFRDGDPRRVTFDECVAIHASLCSEMAAWASEEAFREVVQLAVRWGLSPHELPIDYVSKVVVPIHTQANLRLLRDERYFRLLKIRRALLDPTLNPDFQIFDGVFGKIRVKSYLTDRSLTGDFKTNREKRWEAHPNSPQFALRRDCFAVELELIDQLLRFQAFPQGTIRYLQAAGLCGDCSIVARCPVTLDPLDFELLAEEVGDPTHGRSAYQVGHLNPLKAGQSDEFRHLRANISWITQDGNRIQGHLTLKQTRELLLRISRNYDALLKDGTITPP